MPRYLDCKCVAEDFDSKMP